MSVLNKEKIEKEIERLGLTKGEVADKMNMSIQSFSRMISGNTLNPRLDNAIGLSRILGVSLDYLTDLTNERDVDVQIKDISAKLGLSLNSIYNLMWMNQNMECHVAPLDELISSTTIYQINDSLKNLYEANSLSEYGDYDIQYDLKGQSKHKQIAQYNITDIYIYELMNWIRLSLDYSDSKKIGIERTIEYLENSDDESIFKEDIPELKEKFDNFEYFKNCQTKGNRIVCEKN
ncbi:MAG: helix-turn-helix transcriptional regulator [Holdemanella sp.]|uniref:XRE family transcriptional regulator n=1 Tax=Holdemanella biformis TaxID=1735 RepID=A0A413CTD9_9FIRM|nr:helix-turn-helix transcriptional regulator [Holdemanella biformis]RGW74733.1 XRE family transcriptional regulator [Holdemanella biformis]